jgi:spore germination protein YaaH
MLTTAALLFALASGQPSASGQLFASPHQQDLFDHANDVVFRAPRPLRFGGAGMLGQPRVKRVVYGYYPYWVNEWENIQWDLLTHISYFAVEINSDGTISARHGWPDLNFVQTAHDHNVRVDLCFTLFSGSGISTLVGSEASRARAISAIITEMEAGGADGVNIDFEGLLSGTRDDFTAFIGELRAALSSRGHPAAGIGIAGPAVDWTNSFDLGALAPLIDVYFIMGYGYHWGGSSKAGPNGQLRITESWRPHLSISYERTLDHYTSLVPAELRSKIVLGVPYYGQEWPVTSLNMHASTTGTGSSRTYAAARRAIAAEQMRDYDSDSENAWYAFTLNGGLRQTWYDDEESLAAKYQLAVEQDIGGVGMWALGYDEDYPELWDTLDAYFTEEPVALVGTRANPVRISEFPFVETKDSRDGPSNYFNRYSCAPALPEYGREWVYQLELCEAGRVEATLSDGTGVDIDLHLLSGVTEADCLARNDSVLDVELEAGSYFLVADTYVQDYVARPGEFTLAATFTPSPGGTGCKSPKEPARGEPIDQPVEEIAGTVRVPGEEPPVIEPHVVVTEESCGCLAVRTGRRSSADLLLAGAIILTLLLARRLRG